MNIKSILEQRINSYMDRNPKTSLSDFAVDIFYMMIEIQNEFNVDVNFKFKFRLIKLVDKKVMLTCDVI